MPSRSGFNCRPSRKPRKARRRPRSGRLNSAPAFSPGRWRYPGRRIFTIARKSASKTRMATNISSCGGRRSGRTMCFLPARRRKKRWVREFRRGAKTDPDAGEPPLHPDAAALVRAQIRHGDEQGPLRGRALKRMRVDVAIVGGARPVAPPRDVTPQRPRGRCDRRSPAGARNPPKRRPRPAPAAAFSEADKALSACEPCQGISSNWGYKPIFLRA